jgi:hypothetical protein
MQDFYSQLHDLRIKRAEEETPAAMATGYFHDTLRPKTPKSAAQLERLIVDYINLSGFEAHKTEVKGTFAPTAGPKRIDPKTGKVTNQGTFIPSGAKKGQADVTSTIYGQRVEWEVKFSKSDRQSVDQKKYEQQIKLAGGFYFIVRTPEDFLQKWTELMDHDRIKLLASIG